MIKDISKETEEILKKNEQKKCLICNREDDYNVCIRCGAIISARKVFLKYFIYNDSLYHKYYYVVYSRADIKVEDKQGEISKKMNSDIVINKLKEAEKRFKAQVVDVGLEALNNQEKQLYFSTFAIQYNRLKENYEYGCKKIGYDPTREAFYIKDINFIEQLKFENRFKNKIYEEDSQ